MAESRDSYVPDSERRSERCLVAVGVGGTVRVRAWRRGRVRVRVRVGVGVGVRVRAAPCVGAPVAEEHEAILTAMERDEQLAPETPH